MPRIADDDSSAPTCGARSMRHCLQALQGVAAFADRHHYILGNPVRGQVVAARLGLGVVVTDTPTTDRDNHRRDPRTPQTCGVVEPGTQHSRWCPVVLSSA